jgi:hypothetical protein
MSIIVDLLNNNHDDLGKNNIEYYYEQFDGKIIVLRKYTILYRSAIDICEDLIKCKKKCSDTNKEGVYFSDNIIIPIGMSFEYFHCDFPKEPFIGKFIVTEDIALFIDKYSYTFEINNGEGFCSSNNLANDKNKNMNLLSK